MPNFICPMCLSAYENNEIHPEYPCCPECNCDLPGDVEVVNYQEFLGQVTVEQLRDMKDHISKNEKLRDTYRDMLCGRVQALIEAKA